MHIKPPRTIVTVLQSDLIRYYEANSRFHEGAVAFGRALEALADDPGADQYLVARLHVYDGNFLDRLGRLREARPELERGCAVLRQANAPFDLSTALTFLGRNAWQQGDYARAHDLLEESLAISRGASEEMATALALFFLGLVEHAMGNEAQADKCFREALAVSRMLGEPRIISITLVHSAPILLALGRTAEARKRLQEGLPVARETHDRWLVGAALLHLGTVLLAQGDPAGARTALLEAVALAREAGSGWYRAWGEVSLGDVYLVEGDAQQAELQYRSGLQVALEANAIPLALDALAGFAELRALAGDRKGALELVGQVSLHPASAGKARARAAEVPRMLDPDGTNQPVAPATGAFEEIVQGILAGSPRRSD
jgi:tetratricopeptide (TPR) repeat protein